MPTDSNPYNRLEYPGHTRPQAHPRRLQTIARLHGLAGPPLEDCRVLELGCGDALQLLWMAGEFPAARCVGVDLAQAGLAKGRGMAAALGLGNVALHHADIMDFDPALGEFDYIIAHGLYSWVPEAVADRLLALCARHLAPQGVAYVSYNVLPAQHLRRMVDEMARYHVRGAADPREAVARARAFIPVLQGWLAQDPVVAPVMDFEAQRWQELEDHTVLHDDLAADNRPVYFADFAARAAGHGLQYVGEASPAHLQRLARGAALLEPVAAHAAGRIEREQYLDFARGSTFRQTVLCHAGRAVAEAPDPAAMGSLSFAADLSVQGDAADGGAVAFTRQGGARVTLNRPGWKAALRRLAAAWPRECAFGELLAAAREAEEMTDVELQQLLLQLYGGNVIEANATPVAAAASLGERPRVFPLARLMAGRSAEIPTLRGNTLRLEEPLLQELVVLLDGSRTVREVLQGLAGAVRRGELALPERLQGRTAVEPLEELLRPGVEQNLLRLARGPLLAD